MTHREAILRVSRELLLYSATTFILFKEKQIELIA